MPVHIKHVIDCSTAQLCAGVPICSKQFLLPRFYDEQGYCEIVIQTLSLEHDANYLFALNQNPHHHRPSQMFQRSEKRNSYHAVSSFERLGNTCHCTIRTLFRLFTALYSRKKKSCCVCLRSQLYRLMFSKEKSNFKLKY